MDNVKNITEFTVTPAKVATSISKAQIFVDEENSSYRATVKAFDSKGDFIGNLEAHFTQEEYDNWGTDGEYIYDLICSKLGIERI